VDHFADALRATGEFVYGNSHRLVVVSLLWTLASLPVVTVGVAESCRRVVEDVDDEWLDAWDAADIDAAQAEARAWLRDHSEACEVVGGDALWEEVSADV